MDPVNSLLHSLVIGRALHAHRRIPRRVGCVWRHDALGDGKESVRSYVLKEDLVRSAINTAGAVAPDQDREFARVSVRDAAWEVNGVVWEAGVNVGHDAAVVLLLQMLVC